MTGVIAGNVMTMFPNVTAALPHIKGGRVSELIRSQGAEAVGNTPEQFLAFVNAEIAKWANVIKSASVEQE